ncbi:flagellar basal body L-ring protein FlgH [Sphingomonas sp. BK235]|jgi:flagellar L-ring protein FlgH|uniref:flagellar basal body L-ring protein FlgH n=1 Tax=Sphingomonas sp. BK235 TaxID=2512131 RepID=UPI0010EC1962|nr:flagellar basal body L-ring protein FlgH [Sphingomonas sp. BK235]TCP37515.1 flagellar L-ring protein precursor FlgH [Sphingomonas sp. BK235]
MRLLPRRSMLLIATTLPLLAGCGAVGRLKAVGKPPRIEPAETPVAPTVTPSLGDQARAGRDPAAIAEPGASASLFRTGAGAFFHGQRAAQVGDILTVRISIADSASLDNKSSRARSGSESVGLPNLLGLENTIRKVLPSGADPATLVNTKNASGSTGSGNTSRSEQINTVVAATVVGVLPNGNLMIRGHQEVRVNFELRQLLVTGIVRPQDIARDNSILSSQIADARISYGGRGQLTDVQQPRWGQQVFDAVFPF